MCFGTSLLQAQKQATQYGIGDALLTYWKLSFLQYHLTHSVSLKLTKNIPDCLYYSQLVILNPQLDMHILFGNWEFLSCDNKARETIQNSQLGNISQI